MSYTFEQLDSLRKEGYGWLSPKGELAVCRLFSHLNALEDFKDKDEELIEALAAFNSDEESCSAAHAAWAATDDIGGGHVYDMWSSDNNSKMAKSAYHLGYIRLGCYGRTLDAEGTAKGFKKTLAKLKEIASMLNIELKTREVNTDDYDRY